VLERERQEAILATPPNRMFSPAGILNQNSFNQIVVMKDISRLCSLFSSYAHEKNYAVAFSELLDTFLLAVKFFDTAEERKQALQHIQNAPKRDSLLAVFEEVGLLSEDYYDCFGELYMRQISKGQHGQYFTPPHVCDLMSALTASTTQASQSVYDPACGSGRMLLSVAKINRNAVFYGADIDGICAKMAVANMLLQSLTGEIAQMNSLTYDFSKGYRVGVQLYDGHFYPWYKEIPNAEDSVIWRTPPIKTASAELATWVVPTTGIFQQGTLF